MKHIFKLAILLIIPLFTTLSANAKALKVYLMMSEYVMENHGNYVETYLNVSSKSIIYAKNSQGKFQANIGVNILFSRNDSIFNYGKYNLLSPEYDDTLTLKPNFVDVQRFLLKKGEYKFDLTIIDNNSTSQPFNYLQPLLVELNHEIPTVASVELVDSYKKADSTSNISKNGYDIVPYVSDFFPEGMHELTFYTEIYGISRDLPLGETFIVNIFLESFENRVKMQDYFRFNRYKSDKIIPILSSLNITLLPSGNYNLVIEARDKENKLIADQRIAIRKSNPNIKVNLSDLVTLNVLNTFVQKWPVDTLNEYIKYLRPISSGIEVEYAVNVVNTAEILKKQQYFLGFWQKRNQLNPEGEWNKYYTLVKEANKLFKTQSRKGYATDRGRVYLQYGIPDSRLAYDREPSLYPYELWQYYKLNNRSNRRFIFTNTDLVSNNYILIHSDAIGEVRDDRWQTRLNKRNNMYRSLDEEKAVDQFGTNLRDAFDISR